MLRPLVEGQARLKAHIDARLDEIGGRIRSMHQDLKAALTEIREGLVQVFAVVSGKIDNGDAATIKAMLALEESTKIILAEVRSWPFVTPMPPRCIP